MFTQSRNNRRFGTIVALRGRAVRVEDIFPRPRAGSVSRLLIGPGGSVRPRDVRDTGRDRGRCCRGGLRGKAPELSRAERPFEPAGAAAAGFRRNDRRDRKSTRLNSSHLVISYAVFCLKKKNTQTC